MIQLHKTFSTSLPSHPLSLRHFMLQQFKALHNPLNSLSPPSATSSFIGTAVQCRPTRLLFPPKSHFRSFAAAATSFRDFRFPFAAATTPFRDAKGISTRAADNGNSKQKKKRAKLFDFRSQVKGESVSDTVSEEVNNVKKGSSRAAASEEEEAESVKKKTVVKKKKTGAKKKKVAAIAGDSVQEDGAEDVSRKSSKGKKKKKVSEVSN